MIRKGTRQCLDVGVVDQLGDRLRGTEKAVGSSPIHSMFDSRVAELV